MWIFLFFSISLGNLGFGDLFFATCFGSWGFVFFARFVWELLFFLAIWGFVFRALFFAICLGIWGCVFVCGFVFRFFRELFGDLFFFKSSFGEFGISGFVFCLICLGSWGFGDFFFARFVWGFGDSGFFFVICLGIC